MLLPGEVEEVERMIGNRVGREILARRVGSLRPALRQPDHHPRLPRIDRVAVDESVELLEAAFDRARLVHVPFAAGIRPVAGRAEHFGQRHTAVGQAAA